MWSHHLAARLRRIIAARLPRIILPRVGVFVPPLFVVTPLMLVACQRQTVVLHVDLPVLEDSLVPLAQPDEPVIAVNTREERTKRRRLPPTGVATRMTCESARNVTRDLLKRMAAPAPIPAEGPEAAKLDAALGDAVVDWMDPHGLWTAAPDATVAVLIRQHGRTIRAAIEERSGKSGTGKDKLADDCLVTLKPLGTALRSWAKGLRESYAEGLLKTNVTLREAVLEPAFEDGMVTKPAKTLARELGARAHVIGLIPGLEVATAAAVDRWIPDLDEAAWVEVLLAAAVRGYLPLIDPHGAWAPNDESAALFDRDLESAPPLKLWATATRTAAGVRIETGPSAPLRVGDVVVSIDGVNLAGLSVEAGEQLSEAPEGSESLPRTVRVLRGDRVVSLVTFPAAESEPIAPEPMPLHTVKYGDQEVWVIKLHDIPDALGEDLARTFAAARSKRTKEGAHAPELAGLVLDLRGNGGGSIDGATSALGLFLSGVPLFPLHHRDGAIETERATEPPIEDRFSGPVAALVDAGTASAAEMMAGALRAYRRAVVIGTNTYGKGCAQEYVDDIGKLGVARLTTLLFALPDGTAVQRVGIQPDVLMNFPKPSHVHDREADLLRAPPTWSGPDVRDMKRVAEVAWPAAGDVGPCADVHLCAALRALASGRGQTRDASIRLKK